MGEVNELAIRTRRIVAEDPGIPIGLLIYRLAGDTTPTDKQRRYLFGAVGKLIESGWLRDVSEGEPGQRPVSRRIYVSAPICSCGDSVYAGYRCPDEHDGGQAWLISEWGGMNECPARKKAGIKHE